MSDAEKPKKRRFWQLHLSTAVLLMIGTGCLLGAQMNEHYRSPGSDELMRGIPFPMFIRIANPKPGIHYSFETCGIYHADNGWNYFLLVANILLCVIVLIVVAVCSEYLIRRREGSKP
jgi:hypothetical protein